MKHNLPIAKLGPAGHLMADAVQACVHCGFCLPTCPTYGPLGQEMDTPRGRISLMKEHLEGSLSLEDTLPHIDRCLGCLACETSCPSGVSYRELIGPFREKAALERKRSLGDRSLRFFTLSILTRPKVFSKLIKLAYLFRPLRKWLPRQINTMLSLLPERLPSRFKMPVGAPSQGVARGRVALVAGCAQNVLDPQINRATIDILTRNQIEVVVPAEQICCGALHWHAGEGDGARAYARSNLRAFPDGVDAIISNAAGCGSCLQEYPLVLKGDALEGDARLFSSRVRDLSVFLDDIGIKAPPPVAKPLRVVYQDACHLRHAQGVVGAPRRVLGLIPGVEVVELANPDICCGSAGIYNLEQPDVADELGRCKADEVLAAKPDFVVSANIGCLAQLRHHLQGRIDGPKILHLAVFLQRSYDGVL